MYNNFFWVACAFVFLHSFSLWLVASLFKETIDEMELHSDLPFYIGLISSIAQIVTAPLFGYYADTYGYRAIAVLSLGATAVNHMILTVFPSHMLVIFTRVPTAFLDHTLLVALIIAVDTTPLAMRTTAFARVHFLATSGIIGHFLGLWLIHHIHASQITAIAASLCIIAGFLAYLRLNPIVKQEERPPDMQGCLSIGCPEPFNEITWNRIVTIMPKKLLFIKFLSGFSTIMMQMLLPRVASMKFHFTEHETNRLCVYTTITNLVVHFVGIKWMAVNDWEAHLIKLAFAFQLATYIVYLQARNYSEVVIAVVPWSMCCGFQCSILRSALTKSVHQCYTGLILGVSISVTELLRITTPHIGLYIATHYGSNAFSYVGCIVSLIILGVMHDIRL